MNVFIWYKTQSSPLVNIPVDNRLAYPGLLPTRIQGHIHATTYLEDPDVGRQK